MAKVNNNKKNPNRKNSKQPVSPQNKKENTKSVLEMNLAEDQIVNYFNWKRGLAILVSMIVLAGIVLASIYWGLTIWGQRRENKNAFFNEKASDMEKDKNYLFKNASEAFIYKKKLELANNLLDNHIYWTNFFNFLEEQTFSDVYYVNFKGNTGGQYTISAQVKDVAMINSQVQRMKDSEIVKDIKVQRVANPPKESEEESEERATFDLILSIDPQLFIK